MTDTVEQAQSEVAAAEAQLAAAEAAEAAVQAAVQAPVAPVVEAAPEPTLEVESPEVIAARRQADGTARPDGREPSTIPEPGVESQDA